MPLTKSQRQKVRRIKIYEFFASKEGKKVLEFDELRALVFTELSKLGCRYELSSPDAANCVIRVFRNKSISCSNGKFCCYGAQCFTRNGNKKKWVGEDNSGKELVLNYASHTINQALTENKRVSVGTVFFDTYVRLSTSE